MTDNDAIQDNSPTPDPTPPIYVDDNPEHEQPEASVPTPPTPPIPIKPPPPPVDPNDTPDGDAPIGDPNETNDPPPAGH
ncbi:hypothetical protein ABUE34_12900 [Kozakia baliensis]|uniref:hypothetical protein n=1 Tax=Kozakia baliensis TaxID=153496 RepID=UPI00345BA229